MSHDTQFAGLSAPDPGEAPTSDFLYKNPDLTDQFLKIGAVTHRHNAHLPLQDPVTPLSGGAVASAGTLTASANFWLTYTLLDAQNGETKMATPLELSTGPQIPAPTITPSGAVDNTGGIMPAGNYFYARTLVDAAGGETTLGPTAQVYIDPGFPSAQVDFTGFAADLVGGAVAWRLWRSYEGEDWHLVTQLATNTFTDAGFDPPDNPARPPDTNTTDETNTLFVDIPTVAEEPAIGSATAIRIYLGTDNSFLSPALIKQVPIACAGATFLITSPATTNGSPPHVSTSVRGAAKIDPDTDILDWHWKRPVATYAALGSGEYGDARITLDTRELWVVKNPSGAIGPTDWGTPFSGGTVVFVQGTGPYEDIEFVAGSGVTLGVTSLGGGSAQVSISATGGGGGGGTSTLLASASNATAIASHELVFEGSGAAVTTVTDLGGGSALITITVPPIAGPAGPAGATGASGAIGATGPAGPAGASGATGATGATGASGVVGPAGPQGTPGIGGGAANIGVDRAGGAGLITPITDIRFIASGGASAGVTNLGGGSAQVSISTTPTPCFVVDDVFGGSAMAGGSNATPIEFVGSGAASATVTRVGGSAVVTITVPTVAGPQGPAGPAGASGATGVTGAAGASGAAGAIGPAGPQGPAGTGGTGGGGIYIGSAYAASGVASAPLAGPASAIVFLPSADMQASASVSGGSAIVTFTHSLRSDVNYTMGSALVTNASAAADIPLGKSFVIFQVTTDDSVRIRLYTTPAKRDADVSRAVGVDPPPNSGLLLELVTSSTNLSYHLSPTVIGEDLRSPLIGVTAASITNLGATGTRTLTFKRLLLEG